MAHLTESEIINLEERARLLRADILRMITRRGAGHPGGSLSSAEIMAVLMFRAMRIDPSNPGWPERDRLILSKGHASALLYAALAQRGFFPTEDLKHWGELDCHLQGHPDRLKTPGVDMSSGILGHGLAVATGLALAARLQKMNYCIYVILGDGECQGGIVWEGAAAAAKYRLCQITAILDYNDVQLDGPVHDIMPVESVVDRWRSFGWHVLEINGHDVCQITQALELAHEIHNKPTMIIAHTTKGKGVSFMENDSIWHGIAPNAEQLSQALAELGIEGED